MVLDKRVCLGTNDVQEKVGKPPFTVDFALRLASVPARVLTSLKCSVLVTWGTYRIVSLIQVMVEVMGRVVAKREADVLIGGWRNRRYIYG